MNWLASLRGKISGQTPVPPAITSQEREIAILAALQERFPEEKERFLVVKYEPLMADGIKVEGKGIYRVGTTGSFTRKHFKEPNDKYPKALGLTEKEAEGAPGDFEKRGTSVGTAVFLVNEQSLEKALGLNFQAKSAARG